MRKKVQKWNAAVVIILAVLIVALFLVVMDVATVLLVRFVELPGYGMTMLSELAAFVYIMIVALIFGYHRILAEKGEGFLRGLYIGGFMTAYCIYEIYGQFYIQRLTGGTVQSAGEILLFVVAVFLIGFNEEMVFRGVVLNMFLDKFGSGKKGILTSTILSGVIFGAVHLTNIFSGVSVSSAVIQAIEAALLGVLFAEIYLRSGNIWITIIAHALTDFASMLPSGIYGGGDAVDTINQLSAINFIAIPIFLTPILILFRKSKLEELVRKRAGIQVVPSEKQCENTAIVALILGIISIVFGCTGYGLGFGVVGLLGAYFSMKDSGKRSGLSIAGLATSIAGIVISFIAAAVMLFVMPEMADEMDILENFMLLL